MNKKIILLILFISLFVITGCNKKTNNSTSKKESISKVLSCSREFTLFHSKQFIDNTVYVDKNNKLIKIEKIEKYYTFDSDREFNMICEGSVEEAENNNKIFDNLEESAECNQETREVLIKDIYYISKYKTKDTLPIETIKENVDENFILDFDKYKDRMISKDYNCIEK